MLDVLFVCIGLAGLTLGGEWLVRGSVAIAAGLGIPPLVIGLTLVGFGTSTPELVTSLQAALSGSPGIAMGNVVGSNIGNVFLILGLTAALAPVAVDARALKRDGTVLMIATLAALGVVLAGEIGRVAGAAFLVVLGVYLTATIVVERRRTTAAGALYERESELVPPGPSGWKSTALALAGLAVLIVAARFLVSGAVGLAQLAGLSETVIGLTIVAIGTSMPELVTSIVAVRKGQGDVAFGNVIGSNIFNILGILGVTAMVQPLAVPAEIIRLDIWVMTAAALVLVIFARTGLTLTRGEGAAMLVAYASYLTVLVMWA